MADNNHKVTIDAAWFAELYAKANQSHNCDDCKEVHTRTRERNIAEAKCKELVKERDELQKEISRIKTSNDVAFATMRNDCEALRNERDELREKLEKREKSLSQAKKPCGKKKCAK